MTGQVPPAEGQWQPWPPDVTALPPQPPPPPPLAPPPLPSTQSFEAPAGQAYPEIVPPPTMESFDEEEPVRNALPSEIESAFISLPEDPRLSEQRERTAAILDRAVLVLGVVGLITVALALVSTLRGNPTLFGWLLPFLFFGLAALCYFLLHRMEAKPANSIEVPLELSDDLTDAIAAREELEVYGPSVLSDDDYLTTLADMDDLLGGASKAAAAALRAEREADLGNATRLYAETRQGVDRILDLRDDLLEEWDDDEDDDDDEYYDDEEFEEEGYEVGEPVGAERGTWTRPATAPRPAPDVEPLVRPVSVDDSEAAEVSVATTYVAQSPGAHAAPPPIPVQHVQQPVPPTPAEPVEAPAAEPGRARVPRNRGTKPDRGRSGVPYRPDSAE